MKKTTKRTISILMMFALLISTFAMDVVPVTAEGTLDGHVCSDTPFEDRVVSLYVPATCDKAGYYRYTCTGCGESDFVTIPALAHEGFEHTTVITRMPTCTEQGEKVEFCQGCGLIIKSSKIDATGHDEGVWRIDYPATPDHDGQMDLYCSGCNMILDTKEFKLHEHEFGYRKVVVEPTCTRDGQYVTICKHCGVAYESDIIPMLGHSFSEWSTNNNGTHDRTCSRCHMDEIVCCDFHKTVTERTCTTWGYTDYDCDVCGFHYRADYLVPLGHNFGKYVDTGDGCTHIRYCSRCDESQTELHDWSEWKYNEDGTFFKQGTKTRVCIVCGATQTETMHHSSIICKVFYPIILWFKNFAIKFFHPGKVVIDHILGD